MPAGSLVVAFLRRDWAIARSYRVDFALELFESVVSLVLFFFLARIVDQTELTAETGLEGGYFDFVVVGLALMRLMQSGLTTFAIRLRHDQTTGTLEALFATPAPRWLLVLGSASYDLLSAALSGVLMLAIAVVFFGVELTTSFTSILILIAAIPASFGLFIALGIAIAAFTVVLKQATSLVTLASTGVAILAGVYFPLSVLPSGLEELAEALPFAWALDLLRASLLGGDPSVEKLLLLVAFCAAALPASFALFGSAIKYAKRSGSLAQY